MDFGDFGVSFGWTVSLFVFVFVFTWALLEKRDGELNGIWIGSS